VKGGGWRRGGYGTVGEGDHEGKYETYGSPRGCIISVPNSKVHVEVHQLRQRSCLQLAPPEIVRVPASPMLSTSAGVVREWFEDRAMATESAQTDQNVGKIPRPDEVFPAASEPAF